MELYAFQLLRQVVKILFTVDMPVNAVCYAVDLMISIIFVGLLCSSKGG